MTNRHPSANARQQRRRKRYPRIDYYPSPDALAVINAKRGDRYPLNINSGVLNAIVIEWADLIGIKYREGKATSPIKLPEFLRSFAHANDFGAMPSWLSRRMATLRVTCGAKTQSGKPCRGKSIPGKKRCKWHGGCSTGPKTAEGKIKALANLRQNR